MPHVPGRNGWAVESCGACHVRMGGLGSCVVRTRSEWVGLGCVPHVPRRNGWAGELEDGHQVRAKVRNNRGVLTVFHFIRVWRGDEKQQNLADKGEGGGRRTAIRPQRTRSEHTHTHTHTQVVEAFACHLGNINAHTQHMHLSANISQRLPDSMTPHALCKTSLTSIGMRDSMCLCPCVCVCRFRERFSQHYVCVSVCECVSV